ncbi:MAG TPA: DUF459 domain-containing protein [Magnetospirillum sp.]|nr:DUF459 domain-containing protein [Magnetospirillum sp.]
MAAIVRRHLAFVAATLLLVAPALGFAADQPAAEQKKVSIAILGDSMADGLWGGVFRALHTDATYVLPRLGRTGSGLGHSAKYDWIAGTKQILQKDKPDIAVVSIGLNDRVSIIVDQHSYAFGTSRWRSAYADRVDALMILLKEAKVPTYWIGLPSMRDEAARADAKVLNAIFAERAAVHGVTFVPMWSITEDKTGETYQTHAVDSSGRRLLVRADDGVHYTAAGYDMLAQRLRDTLQPTIAKVLAATPAKAEGAAASKPAEAVAPK